MSMTGSVAASDVIVVGGRAAGAATAMLLARAGLVVTLVDRERPGADTLSTHALMRGGVVQLHRWGLLPDVIAAGTPAVRATRFHYERSHVTLAIKPAFGVDALYAPRRTVLDPLLVAAARAAGAQVQHRSDVVGLCWDGRRVVGVQVADERRRIHPLPARLVIGADGRRSTIARLVGAPTIHRARHTSSFVYGYFAHLPADGYEWAYRPGGTAGLIPTNDGLTCVFAGHLPARIGRGGQDVLHEVVAAASPDMGERLRAATLASPVRTFTGQPGHLRRPWGRGWALVGDAGAWKDPISAHGLTDALRDAELLAQSVVGVLRGKQDEQEAFLDYQLTRDRLTWPILRASDEIAAMRWDEPRVIELLRTLNAAMNHELETIAALLPHDRLDRPRAAG